MLHWLCGDLALPKFDGWLLFFKIEAVLVCLVFSKDLFFVNSLDLSLVMVVLFSDDLKLSDFLFKEFIKVIPIEL